LHCQRIAGCLSYRDLSDRFSSCGHSSEQHIWE
jgi:hypothetical protein